ncbi:cob(I)yrinic acid a,c-diamide adenosyltransferase [Pseudobacteriovorax antillogorgiicola]|uniref:corrinoid adenosyltransferase n=1 Tax=Pseudobacteriovorax antillogorgiicola TaxID=1513793 RepID=A0A1Y6C8N3_9BACT|nr:cob(I)yrinic acid a,c-diamide adenosyltransferase [Pseudobacteriovorax antillogorgiicola]TCS50682.1 cob(I)yrinic acid a,c-diamide adenosyltransferase [Pseudobacteriovorax antillogorgiicola]SMF40160.1 cob(I)yrinic acid a,c-diamide adenosyltransferase [Pseudobacteriovorax antillogorgiicola]
MNESQKGLLVVYTGPGKGKTTAAFGMAFRALGRGLKVGIVQFIKGKWPTGERRFAETLDGVDMFVMGKGFTWESDDISQDKKAAAEAWQQSLNLIKNGQHPIVILDEITYAMNYGFIDKNEVKDALMNRPPHVTVVVTGRNAPQAILDHADLITEMQAVRHPFTQGGKALIGVDY